MIPIGDTLDATVLLFFLHHKKKYVVSEFVFQMS